MTDPELQFQDLPKVVEGPTFRTEWWIAWGHLRAKKSEAFVNVVTVFAILGVIAGVAVLNWVISVMAGFEEDLKDKILGANSHIVVMRQGEMIADMPDVLAKIDKVKGVVGASPFLYQEMMIRSSVAHTGVVVKGVDVTRTGSVTHLRDDLTLWTGGETNTADERAIAFAAIANPVPPSPSLPAPEGGPRDLPGVFVGKELAETLHTFPGDQVMLINPVGGGATPMSPISPSFKSYRVLGVFDSGMFEYNAKWLYLSNADAQAMLKVGDRYTGVEIVVDDIDDVGRIAKDLEASLGYPFYTKTWKDMNAKLFDALALEKWVMGLILSSIVLIAGLLIVTTLFMVVLTKGREIAILKAMGASRASVLRIFVMEGSFIGFVGTVFGTVLGLAGCVFLKQYGYPLDTDVYYLSTLPVIIEPGNVVLIAVVAFVVCVLCTIYPAWRAASLDPVEALRYE